jgi:signal transduction histidine kinase
MGRLFWKFFVFLWLAQLVTMGGVATAIWLGHPNRPLPPPPAAFLHENPDAPRPPMQEPGPGDHPPPPPPAALLVPLLSGSVVSLIFAAILAWYFSTPIRSLRSAFEAVAGGRLETRVGASMAQRNDELADLGSDFDRMTERLGKLLEAQRRLLHDVSHELRSPLARIQAAADLMHQQPERAVEFIERIERDTARMDALVGELLTIARLDAGMADGLQEEFDLAEIIADVVDDADIEAAAKDCPIVADVGTHLLTRGNRELLHRALENILRNAVRYTAANTRVEVAAHATEGRLRITVGDHGPGVFESDLGAIFEPFFRSGSCTTSGYGLGLAIAHRVVLAHGGSIAAANRPGGGLMVTIDLPCAR